MYPSYNGAAPAQYASGGGGSAVNGTVSSSSTSSVQGIRSTPMSGAGTCTSVSTSVDTGAGTGAGTGTSAGTSSDKQSNTSTVSVHRRHRLIAPAPARAPPQPQAPQMGALYGAPVQEIRVLPSVEEEQQQQQQLQMQQQAGPYQLRPQAPPMKSDIFPSHAYTVMLPPPQRMKRGLPESYKQSKYGGNPQMLLKMKFDDPCRRYKSVDNQSQIPSDRYVAADSTADLTRFTEEDVAVIRTLLPLAEAHKWKYLANKLSKLRSKKITPDYCSKKFHQMYGLPFSPVNCTSGTTVHPGYIMKVQAAEGTDQDAAESDSEGLLGSSLPYVLCKDGWNYIE